MAVVAMGNMLSTLDASMVNVSLPAISQALNTDLATVQWVVNAYLLTVTALLLAFGRLADLAGRKPVYTAGFMIFALGAGISGLAQGIEQLIVMRGIQGIGSAMMMAVGPAILIASFPRHERGKALGLNATAVALGYSLGPGLGGILLLWLDWRSLFFARVPIGLLGALLALWVLREPVVKGPGHRFDFPGAVLGAATLSLLLLGLNRGQQVGWSSPVTLALLAGSGILLFAFVQLEGRMRHPMLQLGLFRNRVFAAANASSVLNYLSNAGTLFLVPFFLVSVQGAGPGEIGVVMTASPIALAVVGPVSGALTDRIGSRWLSSIGLAMTAAALVLLSGLGPNATVWDFVPRMVLFGMGHGMFQPSNNTALMGAVPRESIGIASGMLATVRNLGMALGVAVAGAAYSTRLAARGFDATTTGGGAAAAFHDAFLVLALVAAVGVFASLTRGAEQPASRVVSSPDTGDRSSPEPHSH